MAKKRGGLAGIFDRNKKWLTPVAELAGGAFLGPAAGAIIGGLTGFDREGKSGIGFDAKKGALGGLQGYGVGQIGSAGRTGLSKLFGADKAISGASAPVGASGATTAQPMGIGFGTPTSNFAVQAPELAGGPLDIPAPSPRAGMGNGLNIGKVGDLSKGVPVKAPPIAFKPYTPPATTLLSKAGDLAKSAGQYAFSKEGAPVTAGLLQGAFQANSQNAENDIARKKLELEQRQYEDEQKRKQRLAELLGPLFASMYPGMGAKV